MPRSIFLILSLSKDADELQSDTPWAPWYYAHCPMAHTMSAVRGEFLEERMAQHNAATVDGCTARRRRVTLVFSQEFDQITDAIAAERQLKGWRRDKKEALIRGELEALSDWRELMPSVAIPTCASTS